MMSPPSSLASPCGFFSPHTHHGSKRGICALAFVCPFMWLYHPPIFTNKINHLLSRQFLLHPAVVISLIVFLFVEMADLACHEPHSTNTSQFNSELLTMEITLPFPHVIRTISTVYADHIKLKRLQDFSTLLLRRKRQQNWSTQSYHFGGNYPLLPALQHDHSHTALLIHPTPPHPLPYQVIIQQGISFDASPFKKVIQSDIKQDVALHPQMINEHHVVLSFECT